MKKNNIPDNFLKIVVVTLFVYSMQPWMTWQIPKVVFYLLGAILLFFHWYLNRSKYVISKANAVSFLFIVLGVLFFVSGLNLNGIISYIPVVVVFLFIVTLKEVIKVELIQFITKWVALLLAVSLIFYLLFLAGVPLFHRTIINSYGYDPFDNYFIFIYNSHFMYPRFQSIFLEPGHMTMGLIPLIIINQYNVRNKYVVVLILAELFSLSLAGYVTFFIGLFAILAKQHKKYLVLILIVLAPVINFFFVKNHDNILYKTIGIRLALSDDKLIAGNNRTTKYFDYYFDNIMNSNKKWFGTKGIEERNFGGGNQGVKVLLVTVGIIGVFFIYLTFLSFGFRYKKYSIWVLVFIMLILLLQNSYPFWFSVMFCMILGPPFLISTGIKKNDEEN